jgi:hypothetical protein
MMRWVSMAVAQRRDHRMVCARSGYNTVMNVFALVVKETKHAALLMGLFAQNIDGGGVCKQIPDYWLTTVTDIAIRPKSEPRLCHRQ